MTPCEELGYKVGDKFTVIEDDANYFKSGERVYLVKDDDTNIPMFSKIKGNTICKNNGEFTTGYLRLSEVIKITETTGSSLEETFTTFINSLGAVHDSELSIKKGKYTLYFDDYEFDGDEARIRKVIEMLTDLHIKG